MNAAPHSRMQHHSPGFIVEPIHPDAAYSAGLYRGIVFITALMGVLLAVFLRSSV